MRLSRCAKLKRRPEMGTWFRALELRHVSTPLASVHTLHARSRFAGGPQSSSPFRILYLALNQSVALWEVGAPVRFAV